MTLIGFQVFTLRQVKNIKKINEIINYQ